MTMMCLENSGTIAQKSRRQKARSAHSQHPYYFLLLVSIN
jgi:hypothetical protein